MHWGELVGLGGVAGLQAGLSELCTGCSLSSLGAPLHAKCSSSEHMPYPPASALSLTPQVCDLPCKAELLLQLQQELAELQQLAASNMSAGSSTATAVAAMGAAADANMSTSASTSGISQPSASQAPGPASMLWAAKYAPAAAAQLCGNAAAGQELRQFLLDWKDHISKEAAAGAGGAGAAAGGGARQQQQASHSKVTLDSDGSWFQGHDRGGYSGDSWAVDGGGDGAGRCKALALCGPRGCGKTAAVYAVAQELGFRALEVNPSAERAGAQVSGGLLTGCFEGAAGCGGCWRLALQLLLCWLLEYLRAQQRRRAASTVAVVLPTIPVALLPPHQTLHR